MRAARPRRYTSTAVRQYPFDPILKALAELSPADWLPFVKAHHEEIVHDVLFSLGEMARNGGGTEIQRLVEEARSGRLLGFPF
jgi:hypothetical protein